QTTYLQEFFAALGGSCRRRSLDFFEHALDRGHPALDLRERRLDLGGVTIGPLCQLALIGLACGRGLGLHGGGRVDDPRDDDGGDQEAESEDEEHPCVLDGHQSVSFRSAASGRVGTSALMVCGVMCSENGVVSKYLTARPSSDNS